MCVATNAEVKYQCRAPGNHFELVCSPAEVTRIYSVEVIIGRWLSGSGRCKQKRPTCKLSPEHLHEINMACNKHPRCDIIQKVFDSMSCAPPQLTRPLLPALQPPGSLPHPSPQQGQLMRINRITYTCITGKFSIYFKL